MDQKNRIARSMLATVPIILAGSLALSLAAPQPAEAAPTTRKTIKQKATTARTASSTATHTTTAAKAATVPSTYRVVAGDTVSSVAGKFGLSTASVLALNGLGWKSVIFAGQQLKLSKSTSSPAAVVAAVKKYTIATGDTISAVAKRFGVTPQSVLAANDLTASSIIFPGAHLTIPGPATTAKTTDATIGSIETASSVKKLASTATPTVTKYTIATGDTMSSIAAKFSVSVDAILVANNMTGKSLIYAGRSISIPTLAVYISGRGTVTLLTDEMESNARIIVSTGRELGVPDRGIIIALATAMQESALRNVDYGDLDSVGLFQQRPSIGWGTEKQLLDPHYASLLFYGGPQSPNRKIVRGLIDVPGWQSMSVTAAAQAVQVSAYPQAYAQWEPSAKFWLDELN